MKTNNYFLSLGLIFIFGIIFQIFIFLDFPKFAWMQGMLEAWYVSKGLHFYKDFLGHYTPLLRLSTIPIHTIFGVKQWPTIALYLFQSLLIYSLLFYSSVKFCKSWYKTVPIIFFLTWNVIVTQNQFNTNNFIEFLVLLSIVIWIRWYQKPQKKSTFLMGLVSSVAIFSDQIIIPFFAVMFITIFLKDIKIISQNLRLFILGFLIPTVIVFIWLIHQGLLNNFIYWVIIYPFHDYAGSNLGKALDNKFIFFAIHSPILLIIPLLNKSKKNVLLTLILLTLPISFWFAIFHILRFQISLAVYALYLGIMLSEVKLRKNKILFNSIFIFIITINIYAFCKYALPKYKQYLIHPQKRIMTMLYPDDPSYDTVRWIKKNTPENSKFFILADIALYMESNRLPINIRATNNLAFGYGDINLLHDQIISNPPDYWLIDERIWNRFHNFNADNVTSMFKKLTDNKEIVYRNDYVVIKKN